MTDLIVVGGGAAGLMAAVTAGRRGLNVAVLEKNARVGRKLRITGKGRCNVTNACEPAAFLREVCTNPRFLKSALYAFPPAAAMAFFEELGVPLKVERGERVFPVSDRADDIADALEREAKRAGVRFLRDSARGLLIREGRVCGVRAGEGELLAPYVLLCTGGKSYPATGSNGEGYCLAEEAGHRIVTPRASLVPMEAEELCAELQGLSLRNVELTLMRGEKRLYRELGEMLFTHFGVSGPLVLSASTCTGGDWRFLRLLIDLKPGLTPEKLDERLLRDFSENRNRDFRNALDALLPQKLIPTVVRLSGIPGGEKVHSVTREQRLALAALLKALPIAVFGPRPMDEAIITAGGVDVSEVEPRTMASRLLPGLYFAGEILDMDARTGGYNLQIAWCTAVAAANAISKETEK